MKRDGPAENRQGNIFGNLTRNSVLRHSLDVNVNVVNTWAGHTTIFMAAKRTRANLSLEDINSLFERLFSLIDTSNDDSVSFLNWLKAVKGRFLSEVAEEETRRQAESFTFDEAVEAFGLTYDDNHYLKIEEMPGFELVQPSECFSKVSP